MTANSTMNKCDAIAPPFADRFESIARRARRIKEMADHKIDELDRYIKKCGVEFFTAGETLQLLRLRKTAPVPHVRLWPNIIPALLLADEIRTELDFPLTIANGYRPKDLNKEAKGSRNSQHIKYRAIDLQLPRSMCGVTRHQEELYRVTAEVFLIHSDQAIGFGIYRRNGGDRVHLDVGLRRRYWGGPRKRWIRDLLAENR